MPMHYPTEQAMFWRDLDSTERQRYIRKLECYWNVMMAKM